MHVSSVQPDICVRPSMRRISRVYQLLNVMTDHIVQPDQLYKSTVALVCIIIIESESTNNPCIVKIFGASNPFWLSWWSLRSLSFMMMCFENTKVS